MDFCKECGFRLEPKKVKSGKQTILVFACPKWGKNPRNQIKPKLIAK